LATAFVGKIYKHFESISNYRVFRETNHSLIEMVFLTLCAVLCDANSWADVERFGKSKLNWLRKYKNFENGIPSHDTLGRVFAKLDSAEFYNALQAWAIELAGSLKGQTVAVDGKTLCGSFDTETGKSALHSVSAWACGLKLCLGIQSVDMKSNEIPAVQTLIDMLEIEGAVITGDAMHCQRKTCKAIIDKRADFLLFVKGNQASLQGAIVDYMLSTLDDDRLRKSMRRQTTKEINRSRTEIRESVVIACPANHPVFSQWPGIKTLGQICRERIVNGEVQSEMATFISSLPTRVRDLTDRARSHWSIENSQHHVLDVTFTEDASRIRKGTGPEISSAFRRLALNILQRDRSQKDSIRGKRKRCGWDDAAFDQLLANI